MIARLGEAILPNLIGKEFLQLIDAGQSSALRYPESIIHRAIMPILGHGLIHC